MTDFLLIALALVVALAMRPWRLLAGGARVSPLAAFVALLPLLWALPRLTALPLQLQWSGASLVLLCLGWPLAVPVLVLVAALSGLWAPAPLALLASQAVWQGLVPATLALLLGVALRRWVGPHPFVYILGRGFLGTVLALFVAQALAQWLVAPLPGVNTELSMVARWLMAWGDGFVTGMLVAIFVAYRPEWLATWSDPLYLQR